MNCYIIFQPAGYELIELGAICWRPGQQITVHLFEAVAGSHVLRADCDCEGLRSLPNYDFPGKPRLIISIPRHCDNEIIVWIGGNLQLGFNYVIRAVGELLHAWSPYEQACGG